MLFAVAKGEDRGIPNDEIRGVHTSQHRGEVEWSCRWRYSQSCICLLRQ